MADNLIIFLDISGVLDSFIELSREYDPKCVKALNLLTDSTGAKIIVSSSLRREGLTKIRRKLRRWGVRGNVIGLTPFLSQDDDGDVERGDEIATWLHGHPEVSVFVILDDGDDMGALMPFLVEVDPVFGFTSRDAQTALRILNGASGGGDGRDHSGG